MKLPNQKLKLLYLIKILYEETDEENTITVPEMIAKLKAYQISAERKSIYDDLECLRVFGFDVCSRKTRTMDYYIGSRDFELPELKLLVDSVQSSKFITSKKSLELIKKIECLTSKGNAKKLHRNVYVANRVKTLNEQIYYSVDRIHDAIIENKKVTFKYFDLDVNKEKVYRKDGGYYTESPVALTWDDENYYLITYKAKYETYVHYRVDKMEGLSILDEDRELAKKPFDLSAYSKTMFQMFNGEEMEVTIQFDNELVGVVYDRFGVNVPISKKDDKSFVCHARVAVSPQFLSWVISFGDKAKIISPEPVVKKLYDLIKSVKDKYDE